jgi:alanyl-tRNA synthetase
LRDSRSIRDLFIRFFGERGHKEVPSSSLVPVGDPTLLFTNAGMNQMKPYFMGLAEPPAKRLTSIQKCFRTSDIEEVGDGSHLTFFEMLGNFSVGDYFKGDQAAREGAIPWAWELLTTPQPAGMDLERSNLWVTIFEEDDEAFDLWRKVGVPAERIVRFDESENYWFMGAVGPCGPNTEIYYDYGPDQGCGQGGCAPPLHTPPACHRFIELWNLVFMTLYQDEEGRRTPLPLKNVDTGAGLERWPGPLMWQGGVDFQGKARRWRRPPTNYETDLFAPILARVEELAGRAYEECGEAEQRAMRVVAEHARAAAFLIADGVTPANEGRGFVLRRLIRRAMYLPRRAGLSVPVAGVAESVIGRMAEDHPGLKSQEKLILSLLREEEGRFAETMERGGVELDERLAALSRTGASEVPGSDLFFLHDTYGFPVELTQEVAAAQGLGVDLGAFERLMEEQRARSRASARFESDAERLQAYAGQSLPATAFLGYETTRAFAALQAIYRTGAEPGFVSRLRAPAGAELVLAETPFYAEGGGQVGDQGEVVWPGGRFVVEDTRAVGEGGVVAHVGHLAEGTLSIGDIVEARVDESRRADTMRNHTATHILHAALRQVLGSHVRQAGSLVAPDRLRFDFTHTEALAPHQVAAVEALANEKVRANIPVHVQYLPYEEALAGGGLAFFGEKYAETVRVVEVCEPERDACFSKELCGGTHCHSSGDVGLIVITGESSIGAGMRRIEALTGRAAVEHIRRQEEALAGLAALLRAPPQELGAKVAALQEEVEALRRRLQALERRSARDDAEAVAAGALTVDDTRVVLARVSAPNADYLRDLGDGLKARLGSAVILLASEIDGRPAFLAMSTPDVAKRVPAGDVVREAARAAGGGGGGRPELAQGGGSDPAKIDEALRAAERLVRERLERPD